MLYYGWFHLRLYGRWLAGWLADWHNEPFLEKFILFPILNIVFYVIGNFGKFGIVPNDMIIKTVLPVGINIQSVGMFGNR